MDGTPSSSDAELTAILEALRAVETLQLSKAVICTDSRCALQRIQRRYTCCHLALEARKRIQSLAAQGSHVTLQWVPSHKGIPGNEMADQLARRAASEAGPPAIFIPISSATKRRIASHVWSFHPDPRTANGNAPPPCITSNLSREESKLLLRLRTHSARTFVHLCKVGREDSDLCRTCGIPETVQHLLQECVDWTHERCELHRAVKAAGAKDASTESILYPVGPLAMRAKTHRALLNFLKSTGLHTRL